MPVTGLRVRYFLTLVGVLFLVAIVSLLINARALKSDRIAHIDTQILAITETLINSEVFTKDLLPPEAIEKIISEELGPSRIGKLIVLRDDKGNLLFESGGAKLIKSSLLPTSPVWTDIVIGARYIRIYNLKIGETSGKLLQVGFVAEDKIINARIFNRESFAFLALILIVGLAASYLSTSFLLRPITELEKFVTESRNLSKGQSQLSLIPKELLGKSSQQSSDEFSRLVYGLNRLIDKLNKNHQLSRLWAHQMAHELKTPLSILTLEVENIEKQKNTTNVTETASLKLEISKISDIISSFLAWAELENSTTQQKIFVNDLFALTNEISSRLLKNSNRKLDIQFSEKLSVVCNPQHLEQIIVNLISNADSYSDKDLPIAIIFTNQTLTIKDRGKGIPENVLERIGEPFNRGSNSARKSGHGLGLAWIKSICNLYSWTIEFKNTKEGTEARLTFNEESLVKS